jgi:hypothetical protein
MDCMVCYEPIKKKYTIRGCKHILCATCASVLRELPESKNLSDIQFQTTLPFPIKIPGVKSRIKCPMCRQVEPGIELSTLEKTNPVEYYKFMQLEMNQCPDGSSYFVLTRLLWFTPVQKTNFPYFHKPKFVNKSKFKY